MILMGCRIPQAERLPPGYRLAYTQSFDDPHSIAQFEFTDPERWQINPEGKDCGALEFTGMGDYQPAVRSPVIIGLLSNRIFGNFILEADFLQTGKDYGHRDMCLFFGFQDPTHFYYVHLATTADDHAHNIFVVNGADRIKIAEKTTEGIDWKRDFWHQVRIERNLADGAIRAYFDNLATPIMVAHDNSFGTGYIGIGSFDDSGKIDNLRIWSFDALEKPANFYTKILH